VISRSPAGWPVSQAATAGSFTRGSSLNDAMVTAMAIPAMGGVDHGSSRVGCENRALRGLRPERQLDILAAAEQLGLVEKGGAAWDAVLSAKQDKAVGVGATIDPSPNQHLGIESQNRPQINDLLSPDHDSGQTDSGITSKILQLHRSPPPYCGNSPIDSAQASDLNSLGGCGRNISKPPSVRRSTYLSEPAPVNIGARLSNRLSPMRIDCRPSARWRRAAPGAPCTRRLYRVGACPPVLPPAPAGAAAFGAVDEPDPCVCVCVWLAVSRA
jgi:hypothetical protein